MATQQNQKKSDSQSQKGGSQKESGKSGKNQTKK